MSTLVVIAWLAVFVGALLMLGLVGTLAWWQHRQEHPPVPAAERAELVRHAAVVAESAARAAERAAVARRRAEDGADAAAAAWQEHERAQRAYDEASRASQRAAGRHTGGEDRSGPREVGRAALAAYRRGELSQDQMLRVWRWSSGWDPEQERREHQLAELRAAQREAYLRYRAASAAERVAAGQADIAEVAARALADEAAAAQEALPDHVAR